MSQEHIDQILNRGVVDVIVREDLEKKLKSGKKLRIKLGIDPTKPDLHLGHSVVLRKLKHFQDAGHQVILLIGGFTATIGDPTGKNEERPPLSKEEVEHNAKDYLAQAGKILDLKSVEVRNNRDWFENMGPQQFFELSSKKSASQIMARRDFRERVKNDVDIAMSEFLYPLFQGYDSVELKSDVEIGGTDQLFNLLVGRDIQKKYGEKIVQDILTVPLIEGLDGIEKMSKSLDNYIGLSDPPNEMFGKIMSIPDQLMAKYFELLTDVDMSEVQAIVKGHPRDAKVRLGKEIVTFYHDAKAADGAEQDFVTKFVEKGIPKDIKEFNLQFLNASEVFLDHLVSKCTNFASSISEARRLIKQGGVSIDGEKIMENLSITIPKKPETKILKVGKRKFARFFR